MADDRSAGPEAEADGCTEAGERLPAAAADVLAGWATSEPPAGFVDRVVAATHGGAAPPRPRRSRIRRIAPAIGAAVGAALAVAGALVLLRGSGGGGAPTEGARVAQDRESIALGARGVAVAEAGSELAWAISANGAAEVHQTHGDVLPGQPGGRSWSRRPRRIEVRGTCFRVEVLNMMSRPQT
jgi:hypothetical protein